MNPETPTSPERHPASDAEGAQYVAPAIVWEQDFVALANASDPECIPGRDPLCTP